MGVRSRLSRAARAWLACLALQLVAVPPAEAAPRPTVTVCAAARPGPGREVARTAPAAKALRARDDAPRDVAPAVLRQTPPPNTRSPRVLVPRLYLRLLSIRR